jgi:hypothetical protein
MSDRLPDDFALVAACCRWPPSPARDQAVNAAAAKITDWDRWLRVVIRHRVEGLAHAALADAGIELPPAVAQDLTARAHRIAARSLATAVESVRLQNLCDAARIPNLVLKGASLAQLGYGALSIKQSRDIDLLTAPECVDTIVQLLERQGYELRQPAQGLTGRQRQLALKYGREFGLFHPASRLAVDVRWQLVRSPPLLAGVDVNAPHQTVALPGVGAVRTFETGDLFAYLSLHGVAHGWSRLKWLADLNTLIASKSEAEILRCYDHARARGAGIAAGLALLLCERLLERELPSRLAHALHGSIRLRILAALAMNAMVGPDAQQELEARRFGTTRVALMQFLLGGGWRNIVAQGSAMSVRLDDILRHPLPAPLHFLYPLLRLPLWLWRRRSA